MGESIELDWDEENSEHLARHGVHPDDVEEVLTDPNRLRVPAYAGPSGERRFGIVGQTDAGRLPFVVVTRCGALVRLITAVEASTAQRRQYRRS